MPDKISNIINHITFLLDMSGSMRGLEKSLMDVFDAQIATLAQESQTSDQETRVTVYVFDDVVECLVYDKDVLRLPSIRAFYTPRGMTAMIDATLKCIEDLRLTPQMYGDHSFLTFVLTDGNENRSKNTPQYLQKVLRGLPDTWTMAALVPNAIGMHNAKNFGFPAGNVMIWDATSTQGVEEVGRTLTQVTNNYMVARSSGITSTRNLFNLDPNAVNTATVQASGLTALDPSKYMLIPVIPNRVKWPDDKIVVSDYVRDNGLQFHIGNCYYQFVARSVKVQGNKELVLVGKKDSKVYTGPQVRKLIGLPDHDVSIKRGNINPDFDLFIQSTAPNRHLIPHTKVLVLK